MHKTSRCSASAKTLRDLFRKRFSSQKLAAIHRRHQKCRRRKPEISFAKLVLAVVYHVFMGKGALQTHVEELSGVLLSGSALSQRRQRLPWQVFRDILAECLGPRAQLRQHPEAFYKGLRLLGLDGTSFGVNNVPRLVRSLGKAASRRFKAAFARVRTVIIVELGLHNPIAAAIGRNGESELALAWELVGQVPECSLLLADRLYGHALFACGLLARCLEVKADFLVRVRQKLKVRVMEVLADGSTIVELRARADDGKKFPFLVREIRGQVRGRGSKLISVRLWSSLLDAKRYPAAELLALYAQRWEVEITVKELKLELRGSDQLSSQTPETMAQEIAALLLAQALLVDARCTAARQGEVTVLRISFRETLRLVRGLWTLLVIGEGIHSAKQVRALIRRTLKRISGHVTPQRRDRSCPRAVRQPVSSWPRLLRRREVHGLFRYQITPHRGSIC